MHQLPISAVLDVCGDILQASNQNSNSPTLDISSVDHGQLFDYCYTLLLPELWIHLFPSNLKTQELCFTAKYKVRLCVLLKTERGAQRPQRALHHAIDMQPAHCIDNKTYKRVSCCPVVVMAAAPEGQGLQTCTCLLVMYGCTHCVTGSVNLGSASKVQTNWD